MPSWMIGGLRLSVCAALLIYVVGKLSWHDHVTLNDGTQVRLLQLGADHAVVQLHTGESRQLSSTHFRSNPSGAGIEVQVGLQSALENVRPGLMLLALLFWAPQPLLLAARLRWLLQVQGIHLRAWDVVRLTYLGNLLNFALPGTNGGDVAKAYCVARDVENRHAVVATMLFDRALGLLGLVGIGASVALLNWRNPIVRDWGWPVVGLLSALAVAMFLYVVPTTRRILRVSKLFDSSRFGRHLQRVDHSFLVFGRAPRRLLAAGALTLMLHGVTIVSVFFIGWSLGMVDSARPIASLSTYFAYVPLGWIVSAVPISIQGVGLLEEAYMRLFGNLAGLAPSTSAAFVLALFVRLVQLVWALPGALVAMTLRRGIAADSARGIHEAANPPRPSPPPGARPTQPIPEPVVPVPVGNGVDRGAVRRPNGEWFPGGDRRPKSSEVLR